jgi:excisionase family DNA binding protein
LNTIALPKLLNPKQVTEILSISRGTLQALCRRRKIRFVKVGGQLRFEDQDLADFVRSNKSKIKPF